MVENRSAGLLFLPMSLPLFWQVLTPLLVEEIESLQVLEVSLIILLCIEFCWVSSSQEEEVFFVEVEKAKQFFMPLFLREVLQQFLS